MDLSVHGTSHPSKGDCLGSVYQNNDNDHSLNNENPAKRKRKHESIESGRDSQKEKYILHAIDLKWKNAAIGRWQEALGLVEITAMKGNFWNKVGFSINQRSFLYPEEALLLIERGQLYLPNDNFFSPSDISAGVHTVNASYINSSPDNSKLNISGIYNKIISIISLSVYLVYAKLKVCVQNTSCINHNFV